MKKPWDEMTDEEKQDEVIDLNESLRHEAEWSHIKDQKLEELADLVTRFTTGAIDADPFMDAVVEIGEWWININSSGD